MQAIMETLFDAVYLTTVITLGILMIAKSKGNKQYLLFGIMAVVLGLAIRFILFPVRLHCVQPARKLCGSAWNRKIYHLYHHDFFLYSSVLCLENPI